jgi:hypothetical protein
MLPLEHHGGCWALGNALLQDCTPTVGSTCCPIGIASTVLQRGVVLVWCCAVVHCSAAPPGLLCGAHRTAVAAPLHLVVGSRTPTWCLLEFILGPNLWQHYCTSSTMKFTRWQIWMLMCPCGPASAWHHYADGATAACEPDCMRIHCCLCLACTSVSTLGVAYAER